MTDVMDFMQRFPNDNACLEHVFLQRFGKNPICSGCDRPAKWYRIRSIKAFRTNCCCSSIAPLANTLFHQTKIPLALWFYAMLFFANSRSGVQSSFLAAHLGIGDRAAWRMATCIREHMAALEAGRRLGGPGKIVRVGTTQLRKIRTPNVTGAGRIRLMGLADDDAACAFPYSVRGQPMHWREIVERIRPHSVLIVEEEGLLQWLGDRIRIGGNTTSLRVRQDVRIAATDPLDGFLLVLKRSLRATHLHIGRESVNRYLGEFAFRYNRRAKPAQTFDDLISSFPDIDRPRRKTLAVGKG